MIYYTTAARETAHPDRDCDLLTRGDSVRKIDATNDLQECGRCGDPPQNESCSKCGATGGDVLPREVGGGGGAFRRLCPTCADVVRSCRGQPKASDPPDKLPPVDPPEEETEGGSVE